MHFLTERWQQVASYEALVSCSDLRLIGRYPSISAEELIEARFILRSGACAWSSAIRVVDHIVVTTRESTDSSPNCADINCLGSINVHQASVNVYWFNAFSVEEFNHTSLLLTHVHDRSRFLRLAHHQYSQQRWNFQDISAKGRSLH